MWDEVKAKLRVLKDLDKTRQVFGARHHLYQFGPQLTDAQITAWESENTAALPAPLRSYYQECGNGGPGPFYGLQPLEKIKGYRPGAPFLDADQLRDLARQNADDDDEDCEFFYDSENSWDVPDEALQGLLSIIDYGCGTRVCLIANGPRAGELTYRSDERGLIDGRPLIDEFHHWLDQEITNFRRVVQMMKQVATAQELNEACIAQYQLYGARDYMVSYLGISKPADLFGEAENRFHGASQNPWYEAQFPRKKIFGLF